MTTLPCRPVHRTSLPRIDFVGIEVNLFEKVTTMPRQARVECEVHVDPRKALGVYSNAFRLCEGAPGRCLLEFLVYSESENRAQVALKISVRNSFLPVIRDSLDACLDGLLPEVGTDPPTGWSS